MMADRIKTEPAKGEPTRAEPAWERVYAHVRELVISGQVAPGEFLEEEQVSAAVGVSRTPVREAFHRLERDRFIDLLPRRGAVVRAVTAVELAQLYETRRILESHVMERIASERLALPAEIFALLEALSDPASFGDVRFQADGDFRFHRTLVAMLDNEVLLGVFDGLQRRAQRVAITAISVYRERLGLIHAQHAALLAALRAGEAAEAVRVLQVHLQPSLEVTSRLPGSRVGFRSGP
jgi:DNA-binding GntR family transcriptional regulator